MYHSITFGDKNTWNDWHLVATSRPVFNPPSLKRKTLDIPGGDGLIDVSEALTGYPVYNNREGSFEFAVMNDYWEWQEAYSSISDYIHGQKMIAFLEDDPSYYYEGRFTVSNWKSDKNYSLITIDYDVNHAHIGLVAVDPEFQYKGFGTKIMATLETYLYRKGRGRLRIFGRRMGSN